MNRRIGLKLTISAATLAVSTAVAAQNMASTTAPTSGGLPPAGRPGGPPNVVPGTPVAPGAADRDDARDAVQHVNKALQVVRKMERDPQLKDLLKTAKGVFIVPDYGRAALGVGAQGGAGVLLVHSNGKWSGPAFYNLGGISLGVQAGASAGQIAMLLMDDKALNSFGTNNKFSLNADAGLTIVNYSARAHGTAGRGDIVMWSDTEGLFGNLSVSVTDVNYDEHETAAYYGKSVAPTAVVSGATTTAKADALLHAMPM